MKLKNVFSEENVKNFPIYVIFGRWHPEYLFCLGGKLNDLLFQRLTDHSNSPPQSSTYSWSRELEIEINFTDAGFPCYHFLSPPAGHDIDI